MSSTSSSWKTPSAAVQAKHNLRPLPDDFEPTEEEKGLLAMYESIKNFERQAARLKETKAREKLEAKEVEFKQSLARKRKVRRKDKPKQEGGGEDAEDSDSGDDSPMNEDSEVESEDDQKTLHKKRQAKLEKWRDEIESKQQAMSEKETKEAAMRDQLLAENETSAIGTTLKRKRLERNDNESDILASMLQAHTPPHEFSKSLGLTAIKGKVLFPVTSTASIWTPPETPTSPNDGAFLVELDNFDIGKASDGRGNNTVAIKFSAPGDSKRFSINIAGPDHNDFDSILFHFNPRQFERGGQLVINDKQTGIWGQAVNLPLSQVPLIFGQTSITLQIQITGEGFDIFIDEKHCARLEHRKELPSKPCSLFLQFPSSDDYASPENWIVYRTWWGNKTIMAKDDLSSVPGVNNFNAIHPVSHQTACLDSNFLSLITMALTVTDTATEKTLRQ
jgi:Galactoside-binding lectin